MKAKRKSTNQIMKWVTDLVVDGLEKNICPWMKPWDGSIIGAPENFESKRNYKGSNVWVLTAVQMSNGYKHNAWVTFNGAKKLGGSIKKGESGYPVTFWKFLEKEVTSDSGKVELKTIPFLKYFTVFNVAQCDGIEVPCEEMPECEPIKSAEKVKNDYLARKDGLTIEEIPSGRAFYAPKTDSISMPTMAQAVKKAIEVGQTEEDGRQHHYSTMFHEMVHSTGAKHRLNREGIVSLNYFGSHEYSKEELVAEMGSAVLCQKIGLSSERVMENTQAYCKNWAKKLKSEPKWIVWAGSRSERAVDYILGESA